MKEKLCTLARLREELEKSSDKSQAQLLQRFFKTGKGEYGEGDIFLGIKVPTQRQIVKNYIELSFNDLQRLLKSKVHEERFCALAILCRKYTKADDKEKKKIFEFYIKNANEGRINNWDLIDLSAPNIVGDFLLNKDRKILYQFASSKNLWKKRIAILSTFTFIRQNDFDDALKISELLLSDEHDLIHKAVGWMLREVGKRDVAAEEKFLKKHYRKMPRTCLRYAIEKFDKEKREYYLKG